MKATAVVNAAVAVLMDEHGQVLLAKRPEGKPWASWWEFPGGKVEDGEDVFTALQRELQEELGTHAIEAYPWLTRTFAYPEKTVKLHFYMVRKWQAAPYGKENQELSWQTPAALSVGPMLPANEPILSALGLSPVYAISNVQELGEAVFLKSLKQALHNGLRLLQVREKQLPNNELSLLLRRIITLAKPHGARVLLNGDIEMALACNADGVHLPASQLKQLTAKPAGLLCGASCHSADEMEHAKQLSLDFAVLSPVLPTKSHPDATAIGWQQFGNLVKNSSIPVYALGGLVPADLKQAWTHGAHGIAMQRAAWK